MRTPLFFEHERLHARIVDFHGWEMPVWYAGIKEEHLSVRGSAGVFDTSHMGEILVKGPLSTAFLDRVLTRSIAPMPEGRVAYAFLLNEQGGIIDDLTVYCMEPGESYLLCVNASNTEKDLHWLRAQAPTPAPEIEDISERTALIALQGPDAPRILRTVLHFDLEPMKKYTFTRLHTGEYGDLLVSKTGYTGAGGAEIFLDSDKAAHLWSSFLENGAQPCGLGARDTLRLEMGYPLHGNDIDETTTPFQAGLRFAVDMGKLMFIGRDALDKQVSTGLSKRLEGLVLIDRGVPRQGCECVKDGRHVGFVTSGSISPVLDTGIALAYLDTTVREDDVVEILVRSKPLKARVTRPPFTSGTYKK